MEVIHVCMSWTTHPQNRKQQVVLGYRRFLFRLQGVSFVACLMFGHYADKAIMNRTARSKSITRRG